MRSPCGSWNLGRSAWWEHDLCKGWSWCQKSCPAHHSLLRWWFSFVVHMFTGKPASTHSCVSVAGILLWRLLGSVDTGKFRQRARGRYKPVLLRGFFKARHPCPGSHLCRWWFPGPAWFTAEGWFCFSSVPTLQRLATTRFEKYMFSHLSASWAHLSSGNSSLSHRCPL